MPSHVHADSSPAARRPRRAADPRPSRLSPTTPPAVESDLAIWPAWTRISVEDLDLDEFDDRGFPLKGGN